MLRAIEGGCILVLLAAFLAYLLAPAIDAAHRRLRIGNRRRPLPREPAILLVYLPLLIAGFLVWRLAAPRVQQWVNVTAPAALERVFGGDEAAGSITRFYAGVPLPARARPMATSATMRAFAYLEDEVRSALDDLVNAAEYARWLVITPVVAFVLLAYAPGFRRSALRVLPHGHLRWRGDEYFRDVNSALAGYVRAQFAASLIVGVVCTAAFLLFRLPDAVAMGVVAGVLELVPVIGPLTVVLMATGQAGDRTVTVVAFLIVLRCVQDYLVYPRLIRRGMHLSTAAVVLAVWCGAALNGAAGVVLSIPAAGFLSVSVRHYREYRAVERLVRKAAAQRRQ
jgi:predicted PurR-regulated permease PerM